ncbi:hypothetical protein [Carnobacterium maltaromaticum]|uniref:hypothetical protein n=1 Tax=Carnobacterium maltaromaticum TaxID=2751 RepID=UPI00295E5F0B|nr:hypothetical protein [Carnobacterium maltaromaticum]
MTEEEYQIAKKEAKKRLIIFLCVALITGVVTISLGISSSVSLVIILPVGFLYYWPLGMKVRNYEVEQKQLKETEKNSEITNDLDKNE